MQKQLVFPILSDKEQADRLNPDNPKCPFYGYIGNRDKVETALDIAYRAFDSCVDLHYDCPELGHKFVCTREVSDRILLLGTKGVGKTEFAKRMQRIIETPFIELDGANLKKPEQIVFVIEKVLKDEYPIAQLVPVEKNSGVVHFIVPPMLIFIDEIHQLSKTMQDSLLKMTEANDRRLILQSATFDFRKTMIVGATNTLEGLVAAFKSRFMYIELERHTPQELAKIVGNKYPHFGQEDCAAISRIHPTARQALDFCEYVIKAKSRRNLSVGEAIDVVSERLGIDEYGLNQNARETLRLLRDAKSHGLSRKMICASLGISEEGFTDDVLPYLLDNELHGTLIRVTNKHHITDEGLEILATTLRAAESDKSSARL